MPGIPGGVLSLTAESLATELEALEEDKVVADVMTRVVVTLAPETTLAEAAHLMVSRGLRQLPVVDGAGALEGMVSRLDILRTCSAGFPRPAEIPLSPTGRTVLARLCEPTSQRSHTMHLCLRSWTLLCPRD